MIVSFRHKGLKLFYETGNKKGIQTKHAARLESILTYLDVAVSPGDLNVPSLKLHALKGDLDSYWAVSVSGNWRVIFRFIGTDVELVDYLDYH